MSSATTTAPGSRATARSDRAPATVGALTPRAATTLVFALNGLALGSWAARIPAIADRLDLSPGELGIALACMAGGAMASMPLAGRAAIRWGSRPPTRLLLGLLGVGVALPALAASLPALCVATLLFGAANGALDVTMNAQGIAVERRVGRPVLSSFHAAFSFGGLAGAALGALAAGVTLDAPVHLALVGALLVGLGTRVTARLLAASADAQGPAQPAMRTPGRLRGLAVLGLAGFMCLLCEGAALDWSAVYVDRDLAGSPAVAALAYAAFSVTMAVGRLTGDRLTERFGPVALVRGGALVAGLGLATAILVARPSAALVGFACLGAGLAVVVPIVFRAAGELPGGEPGAGIAAVSTAGYAGFLAGPPLIGAVAELTGLPVALAMLPLLCVVLAGLSGATAPRAAPVPA